MDGARVPLAQYCADPGSARPGGATVSTPTLGAAIVAAAAGLTERALRSHLRFGRAA